MALAQANEVRDRLAAASGLGPDAFEIVVIRTAGDRILDRPLSEVGGKGLFTAEIEEGLLAGSLDIAVHSSKDMPTALPEGLRLSACLPREDVRDAFVSRVADRLDDLPAGAVIGTSSLRRRAMLLRIRPDLKVVEFRGNVQTRLAKLEAGVAQATLLAYAGLKRLGVPEVATHLFAVEGFLPAVGQGAICIESRVGDADTDALVALVDHAETSTCLAAERAFLAVLDGSCRTPIAGLARIAAGRLRFDGLILKPDGSEAHEVTRQGSPADAATIGADAGACLKRHGGPGFFAASS